MRGRRRKTPDRDVQRGTGQALRKVYASSVGHVAADAAAAEFDALLAQLNDPPPQYQQGAKP